MARSLSALTSLCLGALLLAPAGPESATLENGVRVNGVRMIGRSDDSDPNFGQATLTPIGAAAEKCTALAQIARSAWPDASTEITSATPHSAGAAGGSAAPALPEHCEVSGRLHDRTGVAGQHYAIHFHMRLPTNWNGRFLFQGG